MRPRRRLVLDSVGLGAAWASLPRVMRMATPASRASPMAAGQLLTVSPPVNVPAANSPS
jgi:hypothetical protein